MQTVNILTNMTKTRLTETLQLNKFPMLMLLKPFVEVLFTDTEICKTRELTHCEADSCNLHVVLQLNV